MNILKNEQMLSIRECFDLKKCHVARNVKAKNKMTAYSVIFPLKQGAILKNSVGAKSMYKVVEVGWKSCNKKR